MRKIDITVTFKALLGPLSGDHFATRDEAIAACGKEVKWERVHTFKSAKDAKWFSSLSTRSQMNVLDRAFKQHFLNRKISSVALLKKNWVRLAQVVQNSDVTVLGLIEYYQKNHDALFADSTVKAVDQLKDAIESYGLSLDMDLKPFS